MRFYVHAPTKGVPPLGAVMTPHMTRTYAGWSSRGQIFGQPGTMAVPIGDPAAIREDVNSMAAMGQFSSDWAPNVIFPPIYYEAGDPHEHAPVSRISDDQMPVPAGRAQNRIRSDAYKARHGGQRQVYQPQVVQTWRGMKGTPYG
jgi:hypothetical protein